MTWLIAVVRTQTLPVASGFCGVMFTEHALVRPMVEDNVKLREQRAQATESAGDIVNAPMQGAPVAESSPLRAPLVPRAADEPLELEELSESARTVGSSRSSASGPPIPSVFQSLNLVSHYKKEWVEQRVLGVGSFSRAVLIENANTGELAVSKQVFVGHASGKIISDLEREAIALSKLPSHNHIIRYRTCFLRGETLCIVTDYAAGGTLNHLLKQRRRKGSSNVADGSSADAASFSDAKPLAPDTILRWTAQLLSALLTIHASNLMHRDIKPSNIFLSESSDRADLKLGDFGLSRDVTGDGEDDLAQTTCGTPYYMSPEQVYNRPYSFSVDTWAFGCVAYEISTLERPFLGKNFPDLVDEIKTKGASGERRQNRLDQCRRREPPLPEAFLDLLTEDALFERDPDQRMSLRAAAHILQPLLEPAERALLAQELEPTVPDGSFGSNSSAGGSFDKARRARRRASTSQTFDDSSGRSEIL